MFFFFLKAKIFQVEGVAFLLAKIVRGCHREMEIEIVSVRNCHHQTAREIVWLSVLLTYDHSQL